MLEIRDTSKWTPCPECNGIRKPCARCNGYRFVPTEPTAQTITDFLLARIAEDEGVARDLRRDLSAQIGAEGFIGKSDERGPFTPSRMLSAQLWSHYDGQTRWRNFARGQQIATLADPARVLAECESKRRLIAIHTPDLGWTEAYCNECLHYENHDPVVIPWPCPTLRAVALPYAGHPEYRPEWA